MTVVRIIVAIITFVIIRDLIRLPIVYIETSSFNNRVEKLEKLLTPFKDIIENIKEEISDRNGRFYVYYYYEKIYIAIIEGAIQFDDIEDMRKALYLIKALKQKISEYETYCYEDDYILKMPKIKSFYPNI